MNVLLTGGAGYIGSHTAVTLSDIGHQVVILDNFCNSKKSVLHQLKKILGKELFFVQADVRNTRIVNQTLQDFKIDAVIHFAGLKSVEESSKNPIEYYDNNVRGTLSLMEAMSNSNVRNIVFSSSATVYGHPKYLPMDENHPTEPTNPYGRSKLYVDEILKDLAMSNESWKIVSLRYFNPVGAHESGFIGENPKGTPNNLMPYVSRVATGELPILNIYGSDYETADGTGVRDYVHVMDLARAHRSALDYSAKKSGWSVFNIGTGHGTSVLELVKAFEHVSRIKIPYKIQSRRQGDVSVIFADPSRAKQLLGWAAKHDLSSMCETSWKYQSIHAVK